jgi:hypothetical protein
MPRQINKIKVILAWPSDVFEERKIVGEVIDEINGYISQDKGIEIDLFSWDNDSHPGLHVDGPIGKSDEDLGFEDADLVVGIFWTKFGTPVYDAQSGTEHEIRKSIELWKKNRKPEIMLYFSEIPIKPSQYRNSQIDKIDSFKQSYKGLGIYSTFDNQEEFRKKIRQDLNNFIIKYYNTFKREEYPSNGNKPSLKKKLLI